MLNQKIREERERLGLSQVAVARSSGVARSQLAAFEGGANVSVATLERILAQVSTLRLDVVPVDLDLEDARRCAAEVERYAALMHDAAARMVAALGGRKPDGEGARLYAGDEEDVSPEKRAQLQRQLDDIQRTKARRS